MVSEHMETNSSIAPNSTRSGLIISAQKNNILLFNHPLSVKLDEKNFLLWQRSMVGIWKDSSPDLVIHHNMSLKIKSSQEKSAKIYLMEKTRSASSLMVVIFDDCATEGMLMRVVD